MAGPQYFSMIRPVPITDTGGFTRATVGTYYKADGLRYSGAANAPRWEYDPYTKAGRGLLYEKTATNLCPASDDLSHGSWSGTGLAVRGSAGSFTAATGFSGTASMCNLNLASSNTGQHYISQAFSGLSIGGGLSFSFAADLLARPGGTITHAQFVIARDGTFATDTAFFTVRLSDGAVVVAPNVYSPTILRVLSTSVQRSVGTSAIRVSMTVDYNSSAVSAGQALTCAVIPLDDTNAPAVTPAPSWTTPSSLLLDMGVGAVQFESGNPTSYFPTSGATAARAADNMTALMLSNINEPDTTGSYTDSGTVAWSAASSYVAGNRVAMFSLHKIYECTLAVGPVATTPDQDPTHWVVVGPTNKWAMFDASNTTQTVADATEYGAIMVALNPQTFADTVVLDNLFADSARVTVNSTSYDKTVDLRHRTIMSWYDYFFQPFTFKTTAMFTELPPLIGNIINVIISQAANLPKCGTCVVGIRKNFGYARPGAGVGILDYSTKDTDVFGNTNVVERPFSKKVNAEVMISNDDLDDIYDTLAKYRATPLVWAAAGDMYNAMIVYGYYKSFDIVIPYPTQSQCNLEIEGLT